MIGRMDRLMKKPSAWRMIRVAAGFCVSFGATFWLLSIRPEIYGIGNLVGLCSAFVCTFGALLYFWAAGSAFVIHKMGWTYRACRSVGFVFALPGSALFLSHARPMSIANFLLCQVTLTSYIARKIAFPDMSDEEAAAREPLPTMFPK
jgi:hypothetical protein